MRMSRVRLTLLIALIGALALAGCVREEAGPGTGDDAAVTPEATPTPTPILTPDFTDPLDERVGYDLVASEKTYPEGSTGAIVIEYADNAERFAEVWDSFGFDESAPEIDWDRDVVLFFGTGESGSCPLDLNDVRFNPDERLIVAVVDPNLPPETVCTMDWTPRVFVVSVPADALGDDDLRAGILHAPHAEEIAPPGGQPVR
jgi:hypothetical protein